MRLDILRIITMFLIVYLCCPLFAEEDLTEVEMDSLAMKFYRWQPKMKIQFIGAYTTFLET